MHKLTIDTVSHHYGKKPVLQDVSFTVNASELCCLVGPSGCGKSTLLRIIAGLEPIQQGDIRVNDTSIIHTPTRKRNVGLVFQHPSLFPHLTLRKNITFGIESLPKEERDKICVELLDMIGLSKLADHYPHQLSGGQHQRVALARTLATKPKLMLLDEPFANLDHALRRDIREEVVSILKDAAIPIIMVTHDPEEALIMADSMVLLHKNGLLHQRGEPDNIHNHPVDVDAAAFFGSINKVSGIIKGDTIISKLGNLPKADYAPTLADGSEVVIVTRPEGIRIADAGDPCVTVEIKSVRHTGAGWLVRAQIPQGEEIRFHHIYGERLYKGDTTCLTYEPPHIFVFPAYR